MRTRRSASRLAIRLIPAILLLSLICAATARDFFRAEQTSGPAQDE
jgi:hypothetical protein